MNSSTDSEACFKMPFLKVPGFRVLWLGIMIVSFESALSRVNFRWLPFWPETLNPILQRAFTVSFPETTGSLGI